MGRPFFLGFARWSLAGDRPAFFKRAALDRDPDHPAPPILPARWLHAFIRANRPFILVVWPSPECGLLGRPARAGSRTGHLIALVVFMIQSHGWDIVAALAFPPFRSFSSQQMNLLQRLIVLAPVTLPIGLFGQRE